MERVEINNCSFYTLAGLPGIGAAKAGRLIEARETKGNITPDLFSSIVEDESIQDWVDFSPFPSEEGEAPLNDQRTPRSTGSSGSAMGSESFHAPEVSPSGGPSYQVLSETGSSDQSAGPSSSPSPVYPHDRYPPPSTNTQWGQGRGTSQRSSGPRNSTPSSRYQTASLGMDWQWSPPGFQDRSQAARRVASNSSPAPSHPQSSLPKSISFDGKGNWHAYYGKFTAFADENGWSPQKRKNQMWWSMQGVSSDYYSTLLGRNPNLSYAELILLMERRFGAHDPPEVAQMEFARAHQLPEETIRDWADRVVTLANRTFPEAPDRQIQRQGILKFCQGCAEREAGLHALNMRPSRVEEAVDLVTWYIHSRRVIYGRSKRQEVKALSLDAASPPESEAAVQRVDVQKSSLKRSSVGPSTMSQGRQDNRPTQTASQAVAPDLHASMRNLDYKVKNLDGKFQGLNTVVQGLDTKVDDLKTSVDNLNTLVTRMVTRSRARSPGPEGPCYHCGKPGHFQKNCPEKDKGRSVAVMKEDLNDSGSEEEGEVTPWPEQNLTTPGV